MSNDENKNGQPELSEIPEEIKTLARKNGINLPEEPELLKIIHKVNLKHNLPDEILQIIAEVIFQVYKLKDQWKNEESE